MKRSQWPSIRCQGRRSPAKLFVFFWDLEKESHHLLIVDNWRYEHCNIKRSSSAEVEHQSWHECKPKPHSVLSLAKCLCLDHLHPGEPEGCHGDRKTGEDENQPTDHLGLFCKHFHDVCLCLWPVTLGLDIPSVINWSFEGKHSRS